MSWIDGRSPLSTSYEILNLVCSFRRQSLLLYDYICARLSHSQLFLFIITTKDRPFDRNGNERFKSGIFGLGGIFRFFFDELKVQ